MPALVCIDCDADHAADATRCHCGGALDHAEDRRPLTRADLDAPGHGVWRYRDWLGVDPSDVVSLGEGDTPLVLDDELGAHFKLEYTNPTGSFKDRGATVVLSRAREFGARVVVEDSSGNAGTSVAAYAARAGMDCHVFSPASITGAKRAQIEAVGATVHAIEGPRPGVTEAAVAFAAEHGAYYASHAYPPHFLDGCTTLAFEIVRQMRRVPSVLVTPCAMGSNVLGAYRGFHAMREADLIDGVPRIVACQATGFDPIAKAMGEPGAGDPNEVTDGLMIAEPPRRSQLLHAVKASGGTALSFDTQQTLDAMARLHRRGFLVEPSSAVVAAALERLRDEGHLEAADDVVCVLTGRFKPS